MPNINKIENRLYSVDVLRGLASIGVFIFHVAMSVGFEKRKLPPFEMFGKLWENIPSVFSLGANGVTLFFVLSGFCLGLKPIAAGGVHHIGSYYRDRFARIYPAYFTAVIFSVFVMVLIDEGWTGFQVAAVLVFLQGAIQHWHFALNGALWSMSTEVQFYLAFPIVFLIYKRFKGWAAAYVFLLVLVARYASTQLSSADHLVGGIIRSTFLMNTLAGRMSDFMLGIALAGLWLRYPLTVTIYSRRLLLPAIVIGLFTRFTGPTWLADPMVALMCTVIVAYAIGNYRVNKHSSLAIFGRMSYSFFLLHMPVISLVLFGLDMAGFTPYERFITIACLGFLGSFALSFVLYKMVELPAVKLVRRMKRAED